jgi:hypothetical protein
VEGVIRAKLFL